MKTGKIKFIAILIASLLMSSSAFADTEDSSPIFLSQENPPLVDGTKRPSRAPRNIHLSLEVSYNATNNQLLFTDSQKQSYHYMIVNDNNSYIVSEGNLYFESKDCINVNIFSRIAGTYTLIVSHEGNNFTGSFEIE